MTRTLAQKRCLSIEVRTATEHWGSSDSSMLQLFKKEISQCAKNIVQYLYKIYITWRISPFWSIWYSLVEYSFECYECKLNLKSNLSEDQPYKSISLERTLWPLYKWPWERPYMISLQSINPWDFLRLRRRRDRRRARVRLVWLLRRPGSAGAWRPLDPTLGQDQERHLHQGSPLQRRRDWRNRSCCCFCYALSVFIHCKPCLTNTS